MERRAGGLFAGLVAGAACLAFAPAAFGLGFQNLSSAPEDRAAGAHSDFSQHIEFTNPGDDVRNLTVHLPPGQVGDPTATPKCTVAQLNSDQCPANTQVGVTTTSADLFVTIIPVPLTIEGKVYNLVPQPGEPARFGIVLQPDLPVPPTILQASASLRQDDFGLDTTINDIPNTASGLPIDIKALDLTLFGFANEGTPQEKAFMRNPTSCEEAVTEFEATSYSGSTTTSPATGSASFTPTDCEALDFSPELTATLDGVPANGHPELTTVIEQAATEAGLKRALVYLPADLGPNNDALANLCPIADFQAGNCQAAAQIGSAEAASPLLVNPLAGDAFALNVNGDLGLGIDLEGELALKLVGNFVFAPDFRTGNLFAGLPDIPIAEFELTIDGGPGGLLTAARDLCEPPTPFLEYALDGHNGEQTAGTVDAEILGCTPPEPPTATARLRAKDAAHPRLRVRGVAGSEPLRSMRVKLPRGLRFGEGAELLEGVTARDDSGVLDDDVLEGTRRKLTVTTPAPGGSDVLKLRIGRHALDRTGRLTNPGFPLRLSDVDGLITDLVG